MLGDFLDFAGFVVLVVVVVLVAFLVRRTLLRRRGATLDCALRLQSARPGHGWHVGLAKYTASDLEWFRVFSASPQPKWVLHRNAFALTGRRRPHGTEHFALPHGASVLQCTVVGADGQTLDIELAMVPGAVTAFSAWLESAPPGAHQHRGSSRT